jgi:CBS domain-containing protein
LPVVNEQGVIQGIITLRDLIALIGTSSNPLSVLVSEVMNTSITTINLEDPFTKVVQLMSEHRVRRLPILGKNNMGSMGVITNKDVLQYLLEATESKKQEGNNNKFRGFTIPISELMTK